ncbi:hypothetical protein EJ08DRAFT_727737 [Tothia fuscella]|uniref:Uncharacterized protein n=1 Tax=Tothia fuscella TaxID=1048955 RepID=A0A9P4NGS9_9PEZI|nr:hypothetical protein EJ08DRAFT_727737 [Tothia fuscella]
MSFRSVAILLGLVLASANPIKDNGPIMDRTVAPKGYKIQFVGHSFHVFLPTPLANLAKEAKIEGHETLNFDMLPASYPEQHWAKMQRGQGVVKQNLQGTAELLTLSTREVAPDPAIAQFADFAYQNNQNIKVMVQETWLPVAANDAEGCTPARVGPGVRDERLTFCPLRDTATLPQLQATVSDWSQPIAKMLRTQLTGLNAKYKSNVTSLVPVWNGVLELRMLIVKGDVPGVAKQSSLFMDALGHPQQPLQDFVTYMWFACMYGVSPVGMKALSTNAAQAKVLQELAWRHAQEESLRNAVLQVAS